MKIITRNLGEIEIFEEKIIYFPEGILGFNNLKKFIVLGEKDEIFYWLQSIEDTDVSFVIMDVFKYLGNYNPVVKDSELEILGDFNEEDLVIYNIAVIPENIEKITVNLKAPIIINLKEKKGKQVIINDDKLPIKYSIYEEMKKRSE